MPVGTKVPVGTVMARLDAGAAENPASPSPAGGGWGRPAARNGRRSEPGTTPSPYPRPARRRAPKLLLGGRPLS